HGLAPVIAVVDGTGSTWNNPVCTDSPTGGNVRTYLTRDVPAWLISRLDVDPDRADWTIGGLSYGGTCALQVVTGDPDSYGAVLDLSGERTPVDSQGDHAGTVRDYFGGSADAFRAANPEDLLTVHAGDGTYAGTTAWFVAGRADRTSVSDLGVLADLAERAGMDVTVRKVAGGHDFQTWRSGLRDAFPALASRAGLP
ncbi:alpha/beta hydrolase family protein, partial [uncultured Corynebacterium sp.]|uniref:alpha/beta hydrolase n=1 Tax=uncultured Corynebacterium sp. TaxID=159447 RepID=UPI0025F66917